MTTEFYPLFCMGVKLSPSLSGKTTDWGCLS